MTYGIWNSMEKRFVFGIAAETPRKAERAFRKTCINWRKWRYEIKRLSYANIWEARQTMEGDRMQYSCSLLIPKSDTKTVQAIRAMMAKVEAEAVSSKWNGKKPAAYAHPLLRDGDAERPDDSTYAGCFFMNAKAGVDHPPKIIDAACNPVMDREEVYSGCYANVKVSIYAYNNTKGGKGISAGLVAVQKTKDGARLGGDTGIDGFQVLSPEVEDMLG